MKICFKCKKEQKYLEFYKHVGMKDGYLGKCKTCTKLDIQLNEKSSSKSKNSYDKTEKGVIRILYKSMTQRSKQRNHVLPNFTKQEFNLWLYKNNYLELWKAWRQHNCNKSLKPSVNRKNDFKPYTFNNMELLTDKENRLQQNNDIRTGQSTSGKTCKPVIQYKNGIEIARYISFSSTRRIMGYSMEKSLKTGKIDKKGYSYKYE